MDTASNRIRRANMDDLPQLRELWTAYQFPVPVLERRFTEFKIAESPAGEILGCLGVQVAGHHAHLHAEAFAHPEIEDELRPLFWERLQGLAVNQNIIRFWTQETAPFWKHYAGFREAGPADHPLLPAAFGPSRTGWLTLGLREETQPSALVEQQLQWLKNAQKENNERILSQAKLLRGVATGLAFVLFLAVVAAGFYLVRRGPLPLGQ